MSSYINSSYDSLEDYTYITNNLDIPTNNNTNNNTVNTTTIEPADTRINDQKRMNNLSEAQVVDFVWNNIQNTLLQESFRLGVSENGLLNQVMARMNEKVQRNHSLTLSGQKIANFAIYLSWPQVKPLMLVNKEIHQKLKDPSFIKAYFELSSELSDPRVLNMQPKEFMRMFKKLPTNLYPQKLAFPLSAGKWEKVITEVTDVCPLKDLRLETYYMFSKQSHFPQVGLEKLQLKNAFMRREMFYSILNKSPNLTSLSFINFVDVQTDFYMTPNLKKLTIYHTTPYQTMHSSHGEKPQDAYISKKQIDDLSRLIPQLRELYLAIPLTNDQLQSVFSRPNSITALDIFAPELDVSTLSIIAQKCNQIQQLRIYGCPFEKGSDLATALPTIQDLRKIKYALLKDQELKSELIYRSTKAPQSLKERFDQLVAKNLGMTAEKAGDALEAMEEEIMEMDFENLCFNNLTYIIRKSTSQTDWYAFDYLDQGTVRHTRFSLNKAGDTVTYEDKKKESLQTFFADLDNYLAKEKVYLLKKGRRQGNNW